MRRAAAATVYGCAAVLLSYPEDDYGADLAAVASALGGLPTGRARQHLASTHRWLSDLTVPEAAARYVETFDLHRRHSLHLTFYAHGDTRGRGLALAELAGPYRSAGVELTPGELPDFLPALLELAALSPAGADVLGGHRAALEVLAQGLVEAGSGYAGAASAVVDTLGPASRAERAALARLRSSGPPTEEVGLEPFGPPELVAPSSVAAGPGEPLPAPVVFRTRRAP